ncbi:MAG: Mov34/MPN/PAD-1 family protein [Rhodocyclaceae bacterium]|nr:Mov34/MPN/PAD-1 family protein [Rhodocyclaceae bacterium]
MTSADPTFWIAESAYSEMLQLAKEHCPNETGGMLLGYLANTGSAVVTKIVGPGPNAIHGRFRFTPDGTYQQNKLEERFWATDGRETYLGDWHTHPKSDSTPSSLDKRTLARIALEPLSGTKHPLMAILAGGNGSWSLGAVRLLFAVRRFFWFEYRLETLHVVFHDHADIDQNPNIAAAHANTF